MSRMQLDQVNCRYGAPMGRRALEPRDMPSTDARMRLQRVRLDVGGYDEGGAYWGVGKPLWRAWFIDADGDEVDSFFRAWTRDEAKAQFPGRRFFK